MTPEERAKFDAIKAKHNYQPPQTGGTSDWFTATAPKPVVQPEVSHRIIPPTFPASDGTGLGTVVGNTARTIGNIPSSALNLGATIAKPTVELAESIPGAVKDIAGAGPKEGAKALLGGFWDTYKKIGESIYGGAEQAVEALRNDPQKAIGDAMEYLAKTGIEDPLLIPSLAVGGPKTAGSKADVISTLGKPGAEAIGAGASAVADIAKTKVASVKSGLQDKAVVGLQSDLEKYAGATKSGSKKLAKNQAKTEALNRAGTTGKTAPQVLAEAHLIPRTEGTKFKTSEQADDFLENLAPLDEALDMGLKEVAMSSPPKSLVELEQSTLQRITSQAMPEGDRAALANDVMQEFALLRQKYGNTISVEDMQVAKSSYWRGTKFDSTKPFKSDAYYQVAKSFQQGIEDVATKAGFEDVAQLNREIGDRLEAAKFLKNLDGQTLKYGRLGKYVFMGIGASLGTGIVGKILGAAGGEILGQLLIDASVASPVKRLLLRNLEIKSPEAYQATLEWAKQQGIERELRLALPEGSELGTPLNPRPMGPATEQSAPVSIPATKNPVTVNPKTGRFQTSYSSSPQSRPNDLDTANTIRNASTDSNIEGNIPQEIPKGQGETPKTIPNKEGGFIKNPFAEDDVEHLAKAKESLREAKGLSASDIMKTHPDIQLKKDVSATDIHGKKVVIPQGEALTPYELKGNKVLLQDGETYIVSKNQYQNIKGNAVSGEAKEFAPELKGTEESVLPTPFKKVTELPKDYKVTGSGTFWDVRNAVGGHIASGNSRTNAIENALKNENIGEAMQRGTKYSSYQLPEGKNYKEVLIKAPLETGKVPEGQYIVNYNKSDGTYSAIGADGKELARSRYMDFKLPGLKQATKDTHIDAKGFKSSHWDEPNVISHLRLNERTYKGKKVTFMEELQSDWAREGRSKGFAKPQIEPVKELPSDWSVKLKEENGLKYYIVYDETGANILARNNKAEAIKEGVDYINNVAPKGVPNNPLLKNWQELSIKRALKEAVDNKSDYFAWINGEQTSARYNLATQVDNVKWKKEGSALGTRDKRITIIPKNGGEHTVNIDNAGIITDTSGGSFRDWKGKKLDEVLGKGLADKIMEKETGTLSGEGLKFGGEWANNLYDKQVKNIVEDVTGGRVEVMDMGLPIEKTKSRFTVRGEKYGENELYPSKLKVGLELDGGDGEYVITKVLGDGKFKAKKVPNVLDKKPQEQTFDISTKKTTQQGVRITKDIRDKILGNAPVLKSPSGVLPYR